MKRAKYTMRIPQEIFEQIQNNIKTTETRLFDEKRKQLKIGDEITFLKRPEYKNAITTKIKKLSKFKSFKELLETIPLSEFGSYKTKEDYLDCLYQFYTQEQEKEYGVLAIQFIKK